MDEFTPGREPLQIVEIQQDLCALTYGVAPCQAALGVTGTAKCYNTLRTCQDRENFDPQAPLVLRFVKPLQALPKWLNAIPSVQSISTEPTELNIGGGSKDRGPLGNRAVARVTFQDHAHSDNLVDPYLAERDFDPMKRSTFWSKWRARNPFYQNRVLVIYDGYLGQALAEMSKRTYLIDRITGPDSGGRVQITAKDVLKLADDDRAQAPELSPGELAADVDAAVTGFDVVRAVEADYPESGTLRIGDEVMTYTGRSETAGVVTFTGVARGTDGTDAEPHSAEDRVQLCLRYTDEPVWRVAHDLLITFGRVPAGFIDLAAWDAEGQFWLSQFNVTALITEPTGVNKLLGELSEQALFYIWWDERASLIQLRAVKPEVDAVPSITDRDNIVEGSIGISEDPKQRVSQVWVFWGLRDPTRRLNDEGNYKQIRIAADLEAEADREYGEKRIRKVFARWIDKQATAFNLAVRLLNRYRDTPAFLSLKLDAKDRALWTGDPAQVTTRLRVDELGNEVAEIWQVISAEESVAGEVATYKLQKSEFGEGRFFFIQANDAPSFAEASEEQKRRGGWISRADGTMPDGSEGYVLI